MCGRVAEESNICFGSCRTSHVAVLAEVWWSRCEIDIKRWMVPFEIFSSNGKRSSFFNAQSLAFSCPLSWRAQSLPGFSSLSITTLVLPSASIDERSTKNLKSVLGPMTYTGSITPMKNHSINGIAEVSIAFMKPPFSRFRAMTNPAYNTEE